MTPQRVTLITLGVADLTRAKTFYSALGWSPTRDEGEVVFYQINGMVLGFFGLEPLAKDQGRPDAKLGTGAITLAQNFNSEAEVDAALVDIGKEVPLHVLHGDVGKTFFFAGIKYRDDIGMCKSAGRFSLSVKTQPGFLEFLVLELLFNGNGL